ncbi:MAG TPA: BtrH N-terminal domain-containing protein [Phototrophicaceae bacterium]|nr:BtrH N-terminal domain-containing protein [Phototrophicaceae bacterium]
MTVLKNYQQFAGRHWEIGPIHNILAYQGVPAPHTGKPISEALLLGISGGIAFGYFTFEYQGYDPHVALLTRNTFDSVGTVFDRLALPREIFQTSKPETGLKNLINVLESGHPALVWADAFLLPYNLLPYDERNWMIRPVVVYGIKGDAVYIADRSCQPLIVSLDDLTRARARVKDDKFRVMALDAPDMEKLPAAVQKGIWQCISLYTDAPPKGKREKFGFAGLEYWAEMLTNIRNKHSWERYFPGGGRGCMLRWPEMWRSRGPMTGLAAGAQPMVRSGACMLTFWMRPLFC